MAVIVRTTRRRVAELSIITVLCFGLIPWCFYDAFYKMNMSESSKQFNLYAMPVLAIFGLLALRSAVKAFRLRIEADEQTGISLNGKPPIPWDAIEVDAGALAKNGYLYINYKGPRGQPARFTLDEFRLDYFDELYTMIRNKLSLPDESARKSKPPAASG